MIFFLLALIYCIHSSEQPDLRLIDFGPNTEPKWLNTEEVEALMAQPKHNFMDITDFQNVPLGEHVEVTATFPEQPTHKELVNTLNSFLSTSNMKMYNNKLTSYFNRYYTTQSGEDAANFIFEELAILGASNPSVSVDRFRHSFRQPSVIGRIEGSGPKKDELVILGCHEDSTAGGSARQSPGSDDDASGVMTVLEIFRNIMKHTGASDDNLQAAWKPDRTVEFHFYAAEEAGLLGSQAVANSYKALGKKVYAMMQLDMTIYPGRIPRIGIVQDFVNSNLTNFVKILVDAYSELEFVSTSCGYACSDHASWTRAGYASCFPFEGPFSDTSPWIHTINDTLDHYSLEHGLEFAKIAQAFIIELSSVSSRDVSQ